MAFVITLHLQASADTALSCKPVQPVTRGALALTPPGEGIEICACGLFRTKFNSEQLLFEAFFDVMRIFGSVEPECGMQKRCVQFPLMYRQSMGSIRLFAERSSHSRMLFASPQKYVYIERSHHFRMPHSRSAFQCKHSFTWMYFAISWGLPLNVII